MPTPSTRTPVRIARGSYSNLNGSVSDLQDGEISYAEDQDKLYIKEGSSLVALTYTPASPAFTGTITGVNLTLSGNLTVNGTQTIINTQTLDVEDKQIEIGKVSSPSDTTADQGGIKLKGATDKTFLWVNATDAWTSSEHIVLAASKRLLIGTTTEGDVGADDLTVASSGNTGITVRSGTSNYGSIYFSDGTSGADEYRGIVAYYHNDNSLRLSTNATTALTFDSSQNATFTGIGIFTKSSSDTDHTNNSLPAAESGFYSLNSNGTNGTFSSVGVIANNGTSDQSASFVAKCTSSGYSPEIYITQRNGANSQRNTIAINTLGDATFIGAITSSSGAVSDSKGNLRSIPRLNKSSAHTLVASDAGKVVYISTGGVTFNNSVMSAGDAVTIINDSGSDQTITQGSGCTIHNTADATTGNRTLAGRGMATLWFSGADTAYISGAGLS